MQKTKTKILALVLTLGTSGCAATIPYWKSVDKQQEENFELADELKWQERDQEKQAEEANTPAPDEPLKPSDF